MPRVVSIFLFGVCLLLAGCSGKSSSIAFSPTAQLKAGEKYRHVPLPVKLKHGKFAVKTTRRASRASCGELTKALTDTKAAARELQNFLAKRGENLSVAQKRRVELEEARYSIAKRVFSGLKRKRCA